MMPDTLMVGSKVRIRTIAGHDSGLGLAVGQTHTIIRTEYSPVAWVYLAASGPSHPLRSDQVELLSPDCYPLTAEDGTKHNAVALSAIFEALDAELSTWIDNDDYREPNIIAKQAIRRLFGHAEDSDET